MSTVYVHYEDGLLLNGEEAWWPHEIAPFIRACPVCERSYVRFTARGTPIRGDRIRRYCSNECAKAGKKSRESLWASRKRVA